MWRALVRRAGLNEVAGAMRSPGSSTNKAWSLRGLVDESTSSRFRRASARLRLNLAARWATRYAVAAPWRHVAMAASAPGARSTE